MFTLLSCALLCAAVLGQAPPGSMLWSYTSSTGSVRAPMVVAADGSVVALSTGSAIVGLSPSSGSPLWTVAGNYGGLAASADGNTLYALGIESAVAIDAQTGARLWTNIMVMPNMAQPPTVSSSTLSFITRTGFVLGLHLANGSTWWMNSQINCSHPLSRLTAMEDALFAACGDTLQRLHALTGFYLWKVAERAVFSPLALGPRVFSLVQTSSSSERSQAPTGSLKCYELSTGNSIWTAAIDGGFIDCPAAGPSNLVLLSTVAPSSLQWVDVVAGQVLNSDSVDISSNAVYSPTRQLYYFGVETGVQAMFFNGTVLWAADASGNVNARPLIVSTASSIVVQDDTGVVTAIAM
jgi:hypothetical protein